MNYTQVSNSRAILLIITVIGTFLMYWMQGDLTKLHIKPFDSSVTGDWYAVFGCNTPGQDRRSFDYAFDLPLTALAWQRIGFKSVVQIIGNRTEWETSRPLSWILSHLEARRVNIIFVDALDVHQITMGQMGRIFTVNFAGFVGQPDDYLLTTDADLWPLRRGHFVPRPGMKIVLVHGKCCGTFRLNGTSYKSYPMSNIGASVDTWRQLVNDGFAPANDTDSILRRLEHYFGASVRKRTVYATANWFLDQKTVGILIKHWANRRGNGSIYVVPDVGYGRVDRGPKWKMAVENCTTNRTFFERMYDAHLPMFTYYPNQWRSIQLLLDVMYGADSWQRRWADAYAAGFYRRMNESQLL